ncbi:RNA-binding S4 domain-containing protein [Arvimicrobium flavum]|uniref:RNA-binding S4 domain-containing protein n=1 Tax=Arvimicrobium flavum TaxID=3393320 RepID=UPI00237C4349|nr:RNA-binding S4 domain-containing protein [Mesorhizobium shangrilense]
MPGAGRQRIDKWLFFSRVIKSRSLAAKLVQSGRVRVNGQKAEQASDLVKPGDVLTVNLDRRIGVLRVLAPGDRRGPYEEARLLYEDLSPERSPNDRSLPDAVAPIRDVSGGRPTRKERRGADREPPVEE